ncbi:LamG-like jellyroll fold domain-containing protein [Thalassobellus citreus]|uniref:LamG-like jellyroll fold domain-containing protein n=1 Tax=Thalassobellus citreus TaxID=3367752 RepID=UPI0037B0E8E0
MKANYIKSYNLIIIILVVFSTSKLHAQYCTPKNINKNNTNYISKVEIGGINNSSSGTTGGYVDYFDSVTTTNIAVGETINGAVEITIDGWNTNMNTVVVWMNFNTNNDDDFEDSGERFLFTIKDKNNKSGKKTISVPISIPVPNNAQSGISRMRIGLRKGKNTDFTSCDYKWKAGEVEDYKINFTSDGDDSGSGGYDANYCSPNNIGNFNTNYISKVAIGSINNTSSGNTGAYTYYSSITPTDVTVGEILNGTVSVTINGWNKSENTVVVWMNFNETDDDFEDNGERFLFTVKDNKNKGGNKTIDVPISIPIPNTAELGIAMMRVGFRTGTNTNFTSCDYNWEAGEVEDYKINFKSDNNSTPEENSDIDDDGILDSVDLDDDNDGILDTDEGCDDVLPVTTSGSLTESFTIGGNANSVTFSTVNGTAKTNGSTFYYREGGADVSIGATYTLTFAQPVLNLELWFDNLIGTGNIGDFTVVYDDASTQSNLDFTIAGNTYNLFNSAGTLAEKGSTGGFISIVDPSPEEGTQSNSDQLFGTLSFLGLDHNKRIQSITYTIITKENRYSVNARVVPIAFDIFDADNDGISNCHDLDSDNDGIPDNVEAQSTFAYIVPSGNGSGITDANNDGVDDNYGIGILSPEDTDRDGTPDYLDFDSDNDGKLDVKENGMANGASAADSDKDGLVNPFETNGVKDASWDVNEDIEDPLDLSILPDGDSDLNSGGDLDYRDLFDVNPSINARIDFDGIDDYLSRDSFIEGLNNVTIMAWVKSDAGNTTDMVVAGEDSGCRLWLQSGKQPMFTIKTVGSQENTIGDISHLIKLGEWHHLTGTYTASSGEMKLYVDGELVGSENVGGSSIENTNNSNGNFEIGRLSSTDNDKKYFKGSIDEVRVFNTSLTKDQIQQMIYQEIEDDSGNVKGAFIVKDIKDTSSNATVSWGSLIAYYPMSGIKKGSTLDYSGYNRDIYLSNVTVQDQTAPMPYESLSNGSWVSESTWLYGDVWDIEDSANNKDWIVVKISSDVSANHNIKTSGLIIDTDKTLTILGDHLVENNWYLELNGTLDLMSDSQLLQTKTSDLVTSADGKVKRRQEGTSSAYWYNYWGSPVGTKEATSLSDNNGTTNNSNNSNFKLEMLKDDTEMNCQFTPAYTANGNISTYWLYTFINGKTYWDWKQIAPSSNLKPGVGYTQKGTGIPSTEQQYIFEGKPNNGTILVDVKDVGGPGSVADKSKTEFLLGNPYASAIDIHKFIDDNEGVIEGALNLWQQWSGSSHNLNDYNGGYAEVNKLGAIRASQFVGRSGATTRGGEGAVVPSRYLPVGQGFIVEIIADGVVEFNNSQRVFIKEADADGTYNNGSVFSKSGNSKSSKSNTSNKEGADNIMRKMRLEFNSVEGPKTRRELLLGFSPYTSDEYDYGYDAKSIGASNNDLHLSLEGKDMNIQAYSEITADKVVPLNFISSGSNTFNIKITEFENIDENQEIYLKDNETGTYFDLRGGEAYEFTSEQGKFNTRFEIVFQSEQKRLSAEEALTTENFIYYKNSEHKLFAKKLNTSVSKISIVNMLGQIVLEFSDVSQESLKNGLTISNISSGTYIAYFRTEDHQVLSKKIIVN